MQRWWNPLSGIFKNQLSSDRRIRLANWLHKVKFLLSLFVWNRFIPSVFVTHRNGREDILQNDPIPSLVMSPEGKARGVRNHEVNDVKRCDCDRFCEGPMNIQYVFIYLFELDFLHDGQRWVHNLLHVIYLIFYSILPEPVVGGKLRKIRILYHVKNLELRITAQPWLQVEKLTVGNEDYDQLWPDWLEWEFYHQLASANIASVRSMKYFYERQK